MLLLIDADILVYRIGFTTEDLPEYLAAARMSESMARILGEITIPNMDCDFSDYQCFLTSQDKDNFRYEIYEGYKVRTGKKPLHYNFLRSFLVQQYGAVIVKGEEADDRIGIEATNRFPSSIIVSIDKDLKQIPGHHWNFVRQEYTYVTAEEGLRWFYEQLLQGDRTDTIPGIPGIGEAKAKKALKDAKTELDFYKICCKMYASAFPNEEWHKLLKRNGQLLKIRTKENELWHPPALEDVKSPIEVDLNKTVASSLKPIKSKLNTKKKDSSTLSPKPDTPTPPTSVSPKTEA